MVEEIEEKLEEYYKLLTIKVEYVTFKKYRISISTRILNKGKTTSILIDFNYEWQDHITLLGNIEQIKYYIEKYIIKIFRREENNVKRY